MHVQLRRHVRADGQAGHRQMRMRLMSRRMEMKMFCGKRMRIWNPCGCTVDAGLVEVLRFGLKFSTSAGAGVGLGIGLDWLHMFHVTYVTWVRCTWLHADEPYAWRLEAGQALEPHT